MKIGTREHQDIIAAFEKYLSKAPLRCRLDKEDKSLWPKGLIYQDGRTNDLFMVYSAGYACARCVYME